MLFSFFFIFFYQQINVPKHELLYYVKKDFIEIRISSFMPISRLKYYFAGMEKDRMSLHPVLWFGSGGWIRTNDLRVMSPTSYLCSTPHSIISSWKSAAKVLLFFE